MAVLRLEQLYPFPGSRLRAALEAYPGAELVWAQEEPENMGAWRFVADQLHRVLGPDVPLAHGGPGRERQPGQRQPDRPRPRAGGPAGGRAHRTAGS